MKGKRVTLTNEEQIALQTMVSLEIKNNRKCKEMGIAPVWETEKLKALYEKIAGREWEDLD